VARIGRNPLSGQHVDHFESLVFAVVTHLPNLEGYHAQRLEVIQTCLTTMRQGAHTKHSFIVWDNGSIPELREWLQCDFKPDALILSGNIGQDAKVNIFRMCPPETIVAYSDDDMLFYDDWLRPQLALYKHFPNVAAVTGYPVRTSFRWGNEHTKAWARTTHGAQLELGRFLPQEWEDDFAVSVGRDPEWHAEYTRNDTDARVTYKGKTAYATSHHCQFIGNAGTVASVLKYDGRAVGDERPFDIALDQIGLRLATTERLCRHIGNVIHDELREEIARTDA
jgi:hypothetical protein